MHSTTPLLPKGGLSLNSIIPVVLGIAAAMISGAVKDRISTSQETGASSQQIMMLTNEVNRLETNSVTRDEYNSLKQSNDTKLSASEFQTFKSDLSDRLTEIDGDLKAIRMELVNHNAHLAR